MPRIEPRFTCTIPSIHDDVALNVRIYHPDSLSRPQSAEEREENGGLGSVEDAEKGKWRKKGIVMAHPYAPMGGSYDDRVVGIVMDEFLKKDWIVGTFNFRGAHGSKGHTSWSGRPELDDYTSFAAFFIHYLSYLRPDPPLSVVFPPKPLPISPSTSTTTTFTPSASPSLSPVPSLAQDPPIVVLGGYSYGSLILRHLPPIPTLLQPFNTPVPGSAFSEILLRAHKLADQINLEWINLARDIQRRAQKAEQKRKTHERTLSVTIGGEETTPENRRSSRDVRRSLEGSGRRSLDIGGRLRSRSQRRSPSSTLLSPRTPTRGSTSESTTPVTAISMPGIRYLLISPLTPPISALAAPALVPKFWNKAHSVDVIAKHETLVIFGDQDVFCSVKKVREWVSSLSEGSGGRFEAVEIERAGHFWHEEGVEREMRGVLGKWEGKVRGEQC